MTEPSTHATGFEGEETACQHLIGLGCRILSRNWRYGHYELDIVAADGDTIVFCEVKTDRTGRFGSPLGWVTPTKMRRLARAARAYIASHDLAGNSFRFDVIGLVARGRDVAVHHCKNAFPAPEER